MTQEGHLAEARRVFAILHRLMHVLTADVRQHVGQLDLTIHQAFVIEILRCGPVAMADLAGTLQVTRATATGFVDRLVQKGLVRRVEDRADRRVVRVEITERGQMLREEFQHMVESRSAGLLARLEPEALAALMQGLAVLEPMLDEVAPDRCLWPGTNQPLARRAEALE